MKSVAFAIILFLLPGGMLFALVWGLWHKRNAVPQPISSCVHSPEKEDTNKSSN